MSEVVARSVPDEIASEESRRAVLFRTVAWITLAGLFIMQVLYGVAIAALPTFAWRPLLVITLISAVVVVVSLIVLRYRGLQPAVTFYLIAISIALGLSAYYLEGIRGPMPVALIVVILFAGLMGGVRAALWTAVGQAILVALNVWLELRGALPSSGLSDTARVALHTATYVAGSVVSLIILQRFLWDTGKALEALQSRGDELADAIRRAETAAEAEIAGRQREEARAMELRDAAQRYLVFLQRVSAGDYEARLQLTEHDAETMSEELFELGQYLNTTVESLVAALTEAQTAQRVYVQQSWDAFVESQASPSSYRYAGTQVVVDEGAWLPVMQKAVQAKALSAEAGELGVPLDIRGELIGALGIRGEAGRAWNEEELALARDVVDQLAQTVDRLRLLEDVRRRAALEQTAAEVTASIRAEVEIEGVLERALTELGKALNAEKGSVQVALRAQTEEEI